MTLRARIARLRPWLEVVLGPPVAIVLGLHDHYQPPRCWWEAPPPGGRK